MIVYILTIEHRYGINTYAATTRAGVERQLVDYVDSWRLMESELHIELDYDDFPEDPTERVAYYFDNCDDESYIIAGGIRVHD